MQNLKAREALLGNRDMGFAQQFVARVQRGFGVYRLLTVMAVALSLGVLIGCGGGGGGGDEVNENGILFLVRPTIKVEGIKGPLAMATDLNSDGHPDIVTWISVLFGNGDGTFQDEVRIDELSNVTNFCCVRTVADFNRDGHPDLLDDESVLLGNGDGTFQPAPRFGGDNTLKTVADFNRDGYPDLLTHISPSVRLGNGDGTFQPEQKVDDADYLGTNPFYFQPRFVTDFNLDGYPDLLTRSLEQLDDNLVSTPWVQLGNGDGTFQPVPIVLTDAYAVIAEGADFNLDGYPDLLIINSNSRSDTLRGIQLGNGDGTFQPTQRIEDDFRFITVADFNGDRNPDLVTWSYVQVGDDEVRPISVLFGNGDGTFQPAQIVFMEDDDVYSPSVSGVADFNNDGHSDLIVDSRHFPGSGVDYWLLLSNGDGTFQVEQILHRDTRTRASHLLIAELNSDGLADLIIAYYDQVYIFLNR